MLSEAIYDSSGEDKNLAFGKLYFILDEGLLKMIREF